MPPKFEHRFIDGATPPEKVICEFYRCEIHNACHLNVSDDFMKFMQRIFAKAGIELMFELASEKSVGIHLDDYHRWLEILTAVHEVQGLKWVDGCSVLPAVESLVAKYAALK